jgi:hypothetical protein
MEDPMGTFKSVRCFRETVAGVVVASCAGLPGKRKVHHSPTGYEWGYGGSGPADLSLNILARVRPHAGLRIGAVLLHDGSRVSDLAWSCHQQFKWSVIYGMPQAGFTLTRDDVERWLAARDDTARHDVGRELIAREEMRALAESAA